MTGWHEIGMIRPATSADTSSIATCVLSAFDNVDEVKLIQQIGTDGDTLLELVFELVGTMVGHVLISKLTLGQVPQLSCGAVAPFSVHADFQSRGIGSKLMREAISESKTIGLDVLCLLGDPGYYQKFGFRESHLRSDYEPRYFQHLELTAGCLQDVEAKAVYARAFASL